MRYINVTKMSTLHQFTEKHLATHKLRIKSDEQPNARALETFFLEIETLLAVRTVQLCVAFGPPR